MPNLTVCDVVPIEGTLIREYLPIAASQSLVPGDIVYLNSGLVTKRIAAAGTIDTTTLCYGVVAEKTYSTVNGTSTAFAVNTLVEVIPFWQKCYLRLPTYGATPVWATNALTNYAIINDGGVYKVNLANTTNPGLKVFSPDWGDMRDNSGRPVLKGTLVVGDRYHCAILDAQKQVIV